jgi:hypothetical protein
MVPLISQPSHRRMQELDLHRYGTVHAKKQRFCNASDYFE